MGCLYISCNKRPWKFPGSFAFINIFPYFYNMEQSFSKQMSETETFDHEYKQLSIFRKIYLWWKWDGKYMHIVFKKGVKNLIRWFPVIWKDRDYDDHYIWEILKTKLKFQAKYIGDRNFHLNAKRDAEIMNTCARIADKVQTEYYTSEYMDYYKSKIYFVPISDEEHNHIEDEELRKEMKGSSRMEFKLQFEKFDEFFANYPHDYRVVMAEGNYQLDDEGKQRIAMKMGYYLHNKARRLLFVLMERNVEKWWD